MWAVTYPKLICLQVMYRERAAGMYDELPFAVAQCLIELPYNLVQAFLFALISYWMLGFENNAGAHLHLTNPRLLRLYVCVLA